MKKITQTIVGTTPPLDKNVIWLDSTDSTAPVEKVFINGQWTPMGVDTDDYYTKDDVNRELAKKLNVIESPTQGNLIAMNSQGQATDSGKKIVDFIANPEVAGQNGEVLSVDSEGNPVWTTVTPTGAADTEMSDTSTKAVQNKVIKEYVDNNYARKDGYYSQLTAGSAENLVGQTVDKDAYLIRPTATSDDATNEVANGVASVLCMEGNSVVWNQKFNDKQESFTQGGITFDFAQGQVHLYGRTDTDLYRSFCTFTKNHKYYLKFKASAYYSASEQSYFSIYHVSDTYPNVKSEYKGLWSVVTPDNSNAALITNGGAGFASGNNIDVTANIVAIDLTLLGIDNLTTVADVEAWLAQHVGTKPYYAYNAGTILSAQTTGIKTYGQNLLNPTTKQAKLIPYTWEGNSNVYTIKNVPSANNLQITYTPDATGVAVTIYSYDSENPTPIPDSINIANYGGSGVLYISSATADTYVCIKWNTDKDNDVVPYEDHTYDFDVRKVYGKNNGVEYQCYPNGMRSAGSVHDTLTASEAVVRIGSVDLGTQTWSEPNNHVSYVTIGNIQQTNVVQIITNTTKYSRRTDAYSSWPEGYYYGTRNGHSRVYVKDMSCTTVEQITSAMNGVMLNYLLATPITYTDLIYRDGGIDRPLADVLMNIEVNNWSMEEQLMTPYDENGNPTSTAATISTIYGMDAVEQIDTLNKTCYFAKDVKDNLQALLNCINTNCAETLGGTFSIGDPEQDSKVSLSLSQKIQNPMLNPNEGGE